MANPLKNKYVRRWLAILLLLILALGGWYMTVRVRAHLNPVELIIMEGNGGTARVYTGHLNVGCWNLAHGRGGEVGASNWRKRGLEGMLVHLVKLSDQIAAENLDILVLNEVDFDSQWSENIDQARFIAKRCGFQYVAEQVNMDVGLPRFRLRFGNAILSRFPIREARVIRYHPLSKKETFFSGNHDGLYCEIETPDGPLAVVAVHLEYRSEAVRVKSASKLINIAESANMPVLALGDFNSTFPGLPDAAKDANDNNAIELLAASGARLGLVPDSVLPADYTFPSENPQRKIDWILGWGLGDITQVKTISSPLSDHLMLSARVSLEAQRLMNDEVPKHPKTQ